MRDGDAQATAIVARRRGTTLVVVPQPELARSADPARDGPRPLIGGRYRLVRRLGEGGAGIVWLAVHEVTAREVALKLLRPETSPHPRFVERFHRETRWTSRLQHPGIVQILDAGAHDGAPFVVMEYLDGVTLRDRLSSGASLGSNEVLAIARAIAGAMAHAHEHGIVHRDLKPENVMLLPDGTVKLLDFGVAAPVDEGVHERMTVIGEVLGTPGYMAPEQSCGARATTAFDVYAYGMLLHELLGGDETARAHAAWHDCEPLIAACTAGDPASRPRFVEIVAQLERMGASKTRGVLASLGRIVATTVLLAAAAIVVAAAAIVLQGMDEPAPVVLTTAVAPPRAAIEAVELGVRADVRERAVVSEPIVEVPVVVAEPPPAPRRIDCAAARRRMVEHREAHRWREMLSALGARSCWRRDEYERWATKANFELKNFARCARLGTGSPDPEVARWALACRRRLAFSDG
ncbi:MAG TPA: serine/threonine-protein kinase [Nannocystaceae bacterium]|nr:serine/threonine-protein kinase [Nannocystaceae bacterium]